MLTINGREVTPHELAARAGVDECLLCDGPMDYVAVFLADAEHYEDLVGSTMARGMHAPPEGKERAVVYGLCSTCKARPDTEQAIEDRIFAPVRG